MKIRAITCFTNLNALQPEAALERAEEFLTQANTAFAEAGIDVQSRRMATQPFPQWGAIPSELPRIAEKLHEIGLSRGIDYVSMGPVFRVSELPFLRAIPDVFAAAEGLFAGVSIADPLRGIDLTMLQETATLIQRVSGLAQDGLRNLYLAAIANVGPGTPFFPAAYHDGGPDSFALAIQAADLAVVATDGATTPGEAQGRLAAAINDAARTMTAVAERLALQTGMGFGGLDFSLAPYPGPATSLGGAMERLGTTAGGSGTIAAASLMMNAIEAADFPRSGFSGLMLPVLEDTILGERAAQGTLTISDLLLYSAVCGTGLDCIPLPGDVDESVLVGILLDTAALALRLNKPLTARLMPMPGKQAGDPVAFTFEYFVPSRVMPAPHGVSGLFGGAASVMISPRR